MVQGDEALSGNTALQVPWGMVTGPDGNLYIAMDDECEVAPFPILPHSFMRCPHLPVPYLQASHGPSLECWLEHCQHASKALFWVLRVHYSVLLLVVCALVELDRDERDCAKPLYTINKYSALHAEWT